MDIQAQMITYHKFLTCVLIGIVCADLQAFRDKLSQRFGDSVSPEGMVEALVGDYGVGQEDAVGFV
eukprot:NODE_10218_length_342_cov_38.194539_g9307_i0.p1 GENE.NODE_10218_length_342_cov_38.194539_g9307_i0~~NODE_10218_length_342_cov_38.194539_g9307_i0.p1  ORF type:complete len:66 (+),score=8.97 NODE_10218_length_342_cov_38.194539_g9307_i0:48-245(+)